MLYGDGRLIDLVDRTQIEFRYLNAWSNEVAAQYEEGGVVRGRTEPNHFYSHTGSDTYSFTIQLAASSDEGDRRTADDVWSDYLFLKSTQYADYRPPGSQLKIGPVKPPHLMLLIIGSVRLKGTVRNPSFKLDGPVDENHHPYIIECSFTFVIENEEVPDLYDIREGYSEV